MLSRLNSNSGKLALFILRREKIQTSVWFVILLSVILLVPFVFKDMYGSTAERMGIAVTMQNPAMIAMCGPTYGIDNYTLGAMFANEMVLFTIIAVAIMNIFFVVRHTRRDEERGRIEVIRSLPVGRLSNLTATIIIAVFINVLLALLTGFGLATLQIDSFDFGGSMLFGAMLGASGLFFATVSALFVQLCSSSKSAVGYSFATLGIMYMMRAVGDINNEALSLLSPLGLIMRSQVYVENHIWPVFIILLVSVAVVVLAFYLNSIRDMDQSFIPAKPGRRTASPFLSSSFGLSFRLLRGTLLGWGVAMLTLGASYGSVMGDLESFISTNEMLKQALSANSTFTITEMFISMLMSIIAITCTIPALIAILKIRSEEKRNLLEHLASRAVSRTELLAGYFIIAVASCFIMLFVSVLGLWSASSAVMAEPIAFSSMTKQLAVYIPAMLFILGFGVFIIGALPSLTGLVWAYLGFSFFTIYFGVLMQFPDWVGKLTPFGHIPALPMESIKYAPLIIITAVALALTAAGFVMFRNRDLQG